MGWGNFSKFVCRNGAAALFYLIEKVLLKLSSDVKFSQSLNRDEDDSNGTTSLVCTAITGSLHNLWCGLLFYLFHRQMREACQLGKTISSHTFILYSLLSSGDWDGTNTIEDERTSTQFLASIVPVPDGAHVHAHAG